VCLVFFVGGDLNILSIIEGIGVGWMFSFLSHDGFSSS